MSVTNNLFNILNEAQLMRQKVFGENLALTNMNLTNMNLTNMNLTNVDISKLETINNTMANNIEIMNNKVDILIFKLIKLFMFLFQELRKDQELTIDYVCNRPDYKVIK
jgi:hypothetical protein